MNNDLKVFEHNGMITMDSREVAEFVGKEHRHLLRDIKGYIDALCTEPNFGLSDFFISSTYKDSTGRTLPNYLITRKGCEMVANKLTGEKGVKFTAAYINRFHEYEKALHMTMFKPDSYMIEDPIERAKRWIEEAQERKALACKVEYLSDENDLLSGDILTWATRPLIVALVRQYSSNVYGDFGKGWNDFYKELLYKHSINIRSRITAYLNNTGKKTKPKSMDMLDDTELSDALRTIVAMCRESGIDISETLKNAKMDNIIRSAS